MIIEKNYRKPNFCMTIFFYYYTAIRNIKLDNIFDLNSSLNINSE
ncbi:hypothetical protein AAJ76_485000133, partial [Vairimorpha ceranae]